MQGQLTLEYLILMLAVISMLSVSIMVLTSVRGSTERTFNLIVFHSAGDRLQTAISEVCKMGHGSSREVWVERSMSLYQAGAGFELVDDASRESLAFGSDCDVSGFISRDGNLVVENLDGTVIIR